MKKVRSSLLARGGVEAQSFTHLQTHKNKYNKVITYLGGGGGGGGHMTLSLPPPPPPPPQVCQYTMMDEIDMKGRSKSSRPHVENIV